jgi:hypothetical protein
MSRSRLIWISAVFLVAMRFLLLFLVLPNECRGQYLEISHHHFFRIQNVMRSNGTYITGKLSQQATSST